MRQARLRFAIGVAALATLSIPAMGQVAPAPPQIKVIQVACGGEAMDPYAVWAEVSAPHKVAPFVEATYARLGSSDLLAEWFACSGFAVTAHQRPPDPDVAGSILWIEADYQARAAGREPLWDGRIIKWPVISSHRVRVQLRVDLTIVSVKVESEYGVR